MESNFRDRFQRAFGDAIDLTATSTKLDRHLNAANASFRYTMPHQPVAFRAKGDRKLLEALTHMAVECGESLDAYAKAIGPTRTAVLNLKALGLVPKSYRSQNEQLVSLALLLESKATDDGGEIQLATIGKALAFDILPSKPKLTELALAIEATGYMMEPDPRFGTPFPKDLQSIVTRRSNGAFSTPTPDHVALIPIVSTAAWVATKGLTSLEQSLNALRYLRGTFELTDALYARLELLYRWFYIHPQKPTSRTAEQIPHELRESVMALLIGVIRADGKLERIEVAELLRIGEGFGLNREMVLTAIHNDEPVTVSAEDASTGFRIPAPVKTEVKIDHSLVQSKLRESNDVSRILALWGFLWVEIESPQEKENGHSEPLEGSEASGCEFHFLDQG
ncbi:MAG TPA: hypothetical protein VGL56_20760, partial [Fimbriimonadaceae bacterium]